MSLQFSTEDLSLPNSVWQHRPFLIFWLIRLLLTAGFNVLCLILAWQMYELSNSALNLGLVGLLQFLPRLCLVLVTGTVIDRFNRRFILAASFFIQMLVAILMVCACANIGLGLSVNLIFILSVILGVCRSFDMPTTQAMLPDVVPQSLLTSAIAAFSTATQVATILAPAFGGMLHAISSVLVYMVITAIYALGFTLCFMLRVPLRKKDTTKVNLESLLLGINFIRTKPVLLGAISLDLFAVLLGGAVALLPIYARDILHVNDEGLGLLRSAPAIGALLMSLLLVRYPVKEKVGIKMFAAVVAFGIATIGFGLSRHFLLSLILLGILGAADVISVVVRASLVQLETPQEMRGRVSAVNSLFIGASNQLGEFESGLTAAWFGPVNSVLIGGIGTLIVVICWIKLFPSLYRRNGFELITQPIKHQ